MLTDGGVIGARAARGEPIESGHLMLVSEPVVDGHGRLIADLRVSVTDRCIFRCQYCMPAEGLPWLEPPAPATA